MLWIVKKEKKKSPADCVIGFVETESLQKKTKYGGGEQLHVAFGTLW